LSAYYTLRDKLKEGKQEEDARKAVQALWSKLGDDAKKLDKWRIWLAQGKAAYKRRKKAADKAWRSRPDVKARRQTKKAKENKSKLDRIRYLERKALLADGEDEIFKAFMEWVQELEGHYKDATPGLVRERRRAKVNEAYADYWPHLKKTCLEARSQYELDECRKRLEAAWTRWAEFSHPKVSVADRKAALEQRMKESPTRVPQRTARNLRVVSSTDVSSTSNDEDDLSWHKEGFDEHDQYDDSCGLEADELDEAVDG